MTREPAQVSACIVSWNVREDLLACLESLRAGVGDLRAEVIVVDNASTDGSVEAARQRYPHVKLIPNEVNRGFAAGSNQALAAASGQFLLLLNPDTLVPPGALAELHRFACRHPEAGIIGPKLVNPDGSLQPSCRRFPRPKAALFRHTFLGRLFPRNRWSAEYVMADWDHTEPREVDWVSGACMLIRREVYEAIGPLDEGFFWGSEDVDYCFRAHRAGHKVLYAPTPAIVHRIGASTNQVPIRTFVNFHRSMNRLYRKHFARNALEAALISVGIGARAVLFISSWWVRQVAARVIAASIGRRRSRQASAGGGG
jgi:GT2 family glycosyltransferase